VIGFNNGDDMRRLSSGVESPHSPNALPSSADRFGNSNCMCLLLLWCSCLKVTS